MGKCVDMANDDHIISLAQNPTKASEARGCASSATQVPVRHAPSIVICSCGLTPTLLRRRDDISLYAGVPCWDPEIANQNMLISYALSTH